MATYPFVAAPDHWPRGGVPVLAIAIHMAEGGGTVSWLTRNDGNSAHYVCEYGGRIVQMVREDRAAGSINPQLVRTNDDPPFDFLGETIVYGASANKAALGIHWRNPNAAVVAIEVEGFARNGPNVDQRDALGRLVADIRSRHSGIPTLGHRDFQNYKACPGKLIPWSDYGGHGAEVDMPLVRFTRVDTVGGTVTIRTGGATVIPIEGGDRPTVPGGITRPAIGSYTLDDLDDRPCYLMSVGQQIAFIAAVDVEFTPNDGPSPPDCSEQVAAAITADRAKARVTWG